MVLLRYVTHFGRVVLKQTSVPTKCQIRPHFRYLIQQHSHRYCSFYSKVKINRVIPVYLQAESFTNRTALFDQNGQHTYGDLLALSNNLASTISETLGAKQGDSGGKRVAFLCPNDSSYIITQWAVWMGGSVCVPLSKSHPPAELKYFIQDSDSKLIVTTEEFAERLHPIAKQLDKPIVVLKKSDFINSEDVALLSDSGL